MMIVFDKLKQTSLGEDFYGGLYGINEEKLVILVVCYDCFKKGIILPYIISICLALGTLSVLPPKVRKTTITA